MRIDGVTADVSVWPTVEKCTERLGLLFTLESCLPHQTKEVQGWLVEGSALSERVFIRAHLAGSSDDRRAQDLVQRITEFAGWLLQATRHGRRNA